MIKLNDQGYLDSSYLFTVKLYVKPYRQKESCQYISGNSPSMKHSTSIRYIILTCYD